MSKPNSPFQSLYRLTVMFGSLAVGSMAAYRYGPPPEQLASMIDATVARVHELQGDLVAADPPLGAEQARLAWGEPAAAAKAPAWEPEIPTPRESPSAPQRQGTVGSAVVVEPLGENGLAYRAKGSITGPGGLVRRFDAIGETREQAELAVLRKIGSAQRGG